MKRVAQFALDPKHRAESAFVRVPMWMGQSILGLCIAAFLYSALRGSPISAILAVLRQLAPAQVLVLLAVDTAVFVLMTARWWLIARTYSPNAQFLPMLAARLATFGVSYFTFGPQVGGESVQLLYLRQQHRSSYTRAGVIILLDKSLELSANSVFLIIGLVALVQSAARPFVGVLAEVSIIGLAVVVALPIAYILSLRRGQDPPSALLHPSPPPRKGAGLSRALRLSERLVARFSRKHAGALAAAVGLSLLACAAAVLEYILMASIVGLHLDPSQLVAAWAAAWLSFLVPLPAGAGSLEASQVLTLGLFGVPAATAIGLTIRARGRDIIFGAAGLLLGANLLKPSRSNVTARAVLSGVKAPNQDEPILLKDLAAGDIDMDEIIVTHQVEARIPTRYGQFRLALYHNNLDLNEHLALVMGEVRGMENVLVRVHSECFTSDVLGSLRCDCGEQLERSMQLIGAAQRGVVLYLRQEGRGIGLLDKLRAYNLQDEGLDTIEANLRLGHAPDERDYTAAALMLRDLGLRSINLMTNNPAKIRELQRLGVVVSQRTSIEVPARPENAGYLRTKMHRMNHLLQLAGSYRLSKGPT